jgi:hypothetical protein
MSCHGQNGEKRPSSQSLRGRTNTVLQHTGNEAYWVPTTYYFQLGRLHFVTEGLDGILLLRHCMKVKRLYARMSRIEYAFEMFQVNVVPLCSCGYLIATTGITGGFVGCGYGLCWS